MRAQEKSPQNGGAKMTFNLASIPSSRVVELATTHNLHISFEQGPRAYAAVRINTVHAPNLFDFVDAVIREREYNRYKELVLGGSYGKFDEAALLIAKEAFRDFLRIPDFPGGAPQATAKLQCAIINAMKVAYETDR